MIQRDVYDKLRVEYEVSVSRLKRIQKENYQLRSQIDMIQRDADYWHSQAEKSERDRIELEKDYMQLEVQLKLWKGKADDMQ
jgi:hypothetical protein|tara:strand:- start:557 stop:802 length:246 start_codon:yes stop_codon:yes gene_type:complete